MSREEVMIDSIKNAIAKALRANGQNVSADAVEALTVEEIQSENCQCRECR